ncbi:MAG: hypothetical protein Q7S57_04505 [bacterium]|nr:hypothetical protein [bacterium]
MEGLKWALFHGIACNWREYRFYSRTKHPFLQPTYFSFFGTVNIQKYGRPVRIPFEDEYNRDKWWTRMFWMPVLGITNGEVIRDGHHFLNPENFCQDIFGRPKIVDYGLPRTQEIIKKWGEQIHISIFLYEEP